jgi:hypothetical protein
VSEADGARHRHPHGSNQERLNVGYTALPERLKREVREYAKEGRQHPDSLIASEALSWARWTRASLASTRGTAGWLIFVVIDFALSLWSGSFPFDGNGPWVEARLARRLIKIADNAPRHA